MRHGASAWFIAALWLCAAAGCGDDDADGAPADAGLVEAVEPLDPALAANLPPDTPAEEAEEGRRLFVVCATCHAPDGSGTALAPSLRDQQWIGISGTHEEIQQVIRQGVAEPTEFSVPMPPGGGGDFDDAQIRSLAAYVYALSRTPI